MASSEFTHIVRDLSQLGESIYIKVRKEGVRFASEGEAAACYFDKVEEWQFLVAKLWQ